MRFLTCTLATLVLASAACASACAPPHRDLSPDQIDKLAKLSDVMDVQATVADPQFKKRNDTSFGDADWAAFDDMGNRLQATSRKILQFSKGPDFDALANRLHAGAEKLSAVAKAKDVSGASAALNEIKATCKECHSKFK